MYIYIYIYIEVSLRKMQTHACMWRRATGRHCGFTGRNAGPTLGPPTSVSHTAAVLSEEHENSMLLPTGT